MENNWFQNSKSLKRKRYVGPGQFELSLDQDQRMKNDQKNEQIIKSKTKVILILKLTIGIMCSICFIYQSQQLVTIYLSGNTVVENRVERFKYSQIPAVTVCVPGFLNMAKFAENFLKSSSNDKFKDLYKRFRLFRESNNNNNSNERTHKELYKDMYESFEDLNIPLNETFAKVIANPPKLVDYFLNHNFNAYNISGVITGIPYPEYQVSIQHNEPPLPCFTYFSDFDDNYRNSEWKIWKIQMVFILDKVNTPQSWYYDTILMMLHSPNNLPEVSPENKFLKLKLNVKNEITFTESKSILLPPPYHTNCKNYPIDSTGRQPLRSDCITNCVNNKLEEYKHLGCLWGNSNYRLIRDKVNVFENRSLCDMNNEVTHKVWNLMERELIMAIPECQEVCLQNCVERFYNFDLDTGYDWRQQYHKSDFFFTITIQHSRFPDQTIEHKPILDWITLVSNVGGLLGMWLGFSVFFACNEFINKIVK